MTSRPGLFGLVAAVVVGSAGAAAGLELVNEPVWAAEAFDEPAFGDFAWFGYARRTGVYTPSNKCPTDTNAAPSDLQVSVRLGEGVCLGRSPAWLSPCRV